MFGKPKLFICCRDFLADIKIEGSKSSSRSVGMSKNLVGDNPICGA